MTLGPWRDAPLIAGNWKMHKTPSEARELVQSLLGRLAAEPASEVLLLPPFTALEAVVGELAGDPRVRVGAQNCHYEAAGAFTGEIAAPMLAPLCDYVLVGHSERRHLMGESDEVVRRKLDAVLAAGLLPILAVGETQAERAAGVTEEVVERQTRAGLVGLALDEVAKCTVAYEPVWAIGTGATATPDDAASAAAVVHRVVAELSRGEAVVRVLYGGSVTPSNAESLMGAPGVRGALVGGASLRAEEFAAIVAAAG
jgi:triosephosphate isomerase